MEKQSLQYVMHNCTLEVDAVGVYLVIISMYVRLKIIRVRRDTQFLHWLEERVSFSCFYVLELYMISPFFGYTYSF